MILTCPECAASYFVDDDRIPSTGRLVKCASCGARWTAKPEPAGEPELELVASPDEGAFAREPTPAPEPEPAASDLPGEALPKMYRAKVDTSRKVRQAATMGIVWASLAVALLVAGALAFVFRADVVRGWPKAAGVYAAVGFPVNATGLAIEDVHTQAILSGGHAAVRVTGRIRNVEPKATDTPPIRIQLLNEAGKPVKTLNAFWSNPQIKPGQALRFDVSLLDPPSSARDVEITFDPGAKRKGAAKADAHAPKAAGGHGEGLRGPAPTPDAGHAPAADEGHAPAASH